MASYKPYPGSDSSNPTSSPGEANNNHYSTPRLSSPAAAESNRHTSVSTLPATAEWDQLPYPSFNNSIHHKSQRSTSPRSPRSPMLPPQTISNRRFSPRESPAISRQPSQRTRARSSTVTSDDGRSVFMSEFRKHSGSGARPDMKGLYADQVGSEQAIASDDDSLVIPGTMPRSNPIPRSEIESEPMERTSSSKRSSKIFTRGRVSPDGSIAGDDSESGFMAKVSKLLKTKESKQDLINDILADEAANGNSQMYEEHYQQMQAGTLPVETQPSAVAFSPQYPLPYHYPETVAHIQIPPAGTQLDKSAEYDLMMQRQQEEFAADLEPGDSKVPKRKSNSKKSRSASPSLHGIGIDGIDGMMMADGSIDPLTAGHFTHSKHHRSKSKTSKKSPTMSPAMLPTNPQSKTVPYPSHLSRNSSPPIDILELSALDKPSSSRRKMKRSSKKSQTDYGKIMRHLYNSIPSLDVIVKVVMEPVETARKSEYPNLAIVIAVVELLVFIWLLYQAIIIVEFACAVIRFICYPAIYILKAIASPFASIKRV